MSGRRLRGAPTAWPRAVCLARRGRGPRGPPCPPPQSCVSARAVGSLSPDTLSPEEPSGRVPLAWAGTGAWWPGGPEAVRPLTLSTVPRGPRRRTEHLQAAGSAGRPPALCSRPGPGPILSARSRGALWAGAQCDHLSLSEALGCKACGLGGPCCSPRPGGAHITLLGVQRSDFQDFSCFCFWSRDSHSGPGSPQAGAAVLS